MHFCKWAVSLFLVSICYGEEFEPRLINGKAADPKKWPSSVYASMSGSRCSATVVGKQTLLLAAHCVKSGGKASFTVGPNSYTSTCTRAPQYNGNTTADWVLCLIDRPVIGSDFEHINSNPNRLQMNDELLLTGYGCVNPGGGGGNDGTYRIGTSRITRLPQGSDNDIITKSGAALCYGDSGGPAFYIDPDTHARWVVAVNSRGNISTTSYLSSLSSDTAQKFINDWASKNNQRICGIHADARGCRPMPLSNTETLP